MTQPLVSVLVAVYNTEAYLPRCLDSLLSQTYRNLEIIVVDDGSTDASSRIIDEYAIKDPRILPVHQRNAGLSASRNTGLCHASGEYVTFIDSDDWVESDYVSYLMTLIAQPDCDISLSRRFFTSHFHDQITEDSTGTISPEDMLCDIFYNRIHEGVWNRLYRRSLIAGKTFRNDAHTGEGMEFNTRVLPGAKAIGVGLRRVYTYNVDNQHSATTQPDVRKQALGSIKTLEIIKDTLNPRSERLDAALEYQYFATALYALRHVIQSGSATEYAEFHHRLIKYVRTTVPKTLGMEITCKQKLKSLLVWLSPTLAVRLSTIWRYRLGIKRRF